MLTNAIIANHTLTSIEIYKCRLRNNQLAMFCKAVSEHERQQELENERKRRTKFVSPKKASRPPTLEGDNITSIENFSL